MNCLLTPSILSHLLIAKIHMQNMCQDTAYRTQFYHYVVQMYLNFDFHCTSFRFLLIKLLLIYILFKKWPFVKMAKFTTSPKKIEILIT